MKPRFYEPFEAVYTPEQVKAMGVPSNATPMARERLVRLYGETWEEALAQDWDTAIFTEQMEESNWKVEIGEVELIIGPAESSIYAVISDSLSGDAIMETLAAGAYEWRSKEVMVRRYGDGWEDVARVIIAEASRDGVISKVDNHYEILGPAEGMKIVVAWPHFVVDVWCLSEEPSKEELLRRAKWLSWNKRSTKTMRALGRRDWALWLCEHISKGDMVVDRLRGEVSIYTKEEVVRIDWKHQTIAAVTLKLTWKELLEEVPPHSWYIPKGVLDLLSYTKEEAGLLLDKAAQAVGRCDIVPNVFTVKVDDVSMKVLYQNLGSKYSAVVIDATR